MATRMKKASVAKPADENVIAEETTNDEVVKDTVRKFEKDELIPCRSITGGELLMIGKKTGNLYKWADYDDVQEVEYQDLLYDVRSAGSASYARRPRFVILDDDFVTQNKGLAEVYNALYTVEDLRDLFNMSGSELVRAIEGLPIGVRSSVLTLASTAIQNGELDRVSTIRTLDDYFGTKMLQILTDF